MSRGEGNEARTRKKNMLALAAVAARGEEGPSIQNVAYDFQVAMPKREPTLGSFGDVFVLRGHIVVEEI